MTTQQTITLSFVCPKSIGDLKPCGQSFYCDACEKTVHDFRGMNDEDIKQKIRSAGESICGILDAPTLRRETAFFKWLGWVATALVAIGFSACQGQTTGKIETTKKSDTTKNSSQTIKIPNDFMIGAIEVAPSFPGGESAFQQFLKERIKYDGEYAGRIFVGFTVERDGSLSNFKILRGGYDQLNQQIISILKTSPKWHPAIQNGKPYATGFMLPINLSVNH